MIQSNISLICQIHIMKLWHTIDCLSKREVLLVNDVYDHLKFCNTPIYHLENNEKFYEDKDERYCISIP